MMRWTVIGHYPDRGTPEETMFADPIEAATPAQAADAARQLYPDREDSEIVAVVFGGEARVYGPECERI